MTPPRDGAAGALAELAELGLRSASLVHEIRQPLFVLKGLVDLALAGRVVLGVEELGVLRAELDHVEALLERYGDVPGRPESPEPVELADVVRVALRATEARARHRGVTVVVGPVSGRVTVRPAALRQVVANLLSNAIDAAAGGGRRVEVTATSDGAGAALVVTDDGPGVDPEVVRRLAEPFVTTKPRGEGTGLGLFITRGLCEEWGGQLVLGAAPGGGTRAVVTLPRPT